MTNIINDYSITPGDIPSASEVGLGSIAIQAADGHIYLKRTDGAVVRVTMLPCVRLSYSKDCDAYDKGIKRQRLE
jgi:hypothetical protein